MKHESVLSNAFKEVTQSNLSKLNYETSNYIPVYSIGFPSGCNSNHITGLFNFNYYSRKLSGVFNNNYLNNILLLFYYNKKNGITTDFTEQDFKDILRTNILEVKLLLHSEIDCWIDNPLMINQNISSVYGRITRQNIETTFFKYNYFSSRWNSNMVYNYGFIGKYINNILTPKIVLMTKKEHINTIKKCFILNQNFPKDIFELWVSPELDSYILNLYKGLSGLISENGWKVFKYDMQGILAGIELPSFRSVKQKNDFEDSSWIEFCNKELGVKVLEEVDYEF